MDEADRRGSRRTGSGADIIARRSDTGSNDVSDAGSNDVSDAGSDDAASDDPSADDSVAVNTLRAAIKESRPRTLLARLRPVSAASAAVFRFPTGCRRSNRTAGSFRRA
jgi:hypothetical protein